MISAPNDSLTSGLTYFSKSQESQYKHQILGQPVQHKSQLLHTEPCNLVDLYPHQRRQSIGVQCPRCPDTPVFGRVVSSPPTCGHPRIVGNLIISAVNWSQNLLNVLQCLIQSPTLHRLDCFNCSPTQHGNIKLTF